MKKKEPITRVHDKARVALHLCGLSDAPKIENLLRELARLHPNATPMELVNFARNESNLSEMMGHDPWGDE